MGGGGLPQDVGRRVPSPPAPPPPPISQHNTKPAPPPPALLLPGGTPLWSPEETGERQGRNPPPPTERQRQHQRGGRNNPPPPPPARRQSPPRSTRLKHMPPPSYMKNHCTPASKRLRWSDSGVSPTTRWRSRAQSRSTQEQGPRCGIRQIIFSECFSPASSRGIEVSDDDLWLEQWKSRKNGKQHTQPIAIPRAVVFNRPVRGFDTRGLRLLGPLHVELSSGHRWNHPPLQQPASPPVVADRSEVASIFAPGSSPAPLPKQNYNATWHHTPPAAHLPEWAEEFSEFLHLTGQQHADVRTKHTLIKKACQKKFLQRQVKTAIRKSSNWGDFLKRPEQDPTLGVRSEGSLWLWSSFPYLVHLGHLFHLKGVRSV